MDNPRDDPARHSQNWKPRVQDLFHCHAARTRYKLEQRMHTSLKFLLNNCAFIVVLATHSTLHVGLYYIQLSGESAC